MGRVEVYITGNTNGAPAAPVAITCEAEAVQEAIAYAARRAGLPWLPEKALGRAAAVSVFINGAALTLEKGAHVPLAPGDVVLLECPATDT